MHEENNEVELVIMVSPELVDPMDNCDVPPCGPGMGSRSPNDNELYWQGYGEVPSCGPCAAGDCLWSPSGMNAAGPESIPTPAAAGPDGKSSYNGPRSSPSSGSTPLDPSQPVMYGGSGSYDRAEAAESAVEFRRIARRRGAKSHWTRRL